MEHVCKMLSLSAGLIVTCMLIGFGLLAFRETRQLGTEVLQSLQEMTEDYTEYEWNRYEDVCVSGGEVVNVIRKYQKKIPVSVIQYGRTYTYAGGFRVNDNIPTNSGYIRYADTYRGKVIRDGKDKLSGLYFYLEPAT